MLVRPCARVLCAPIRVIALWFTQATKEGTIGKFGIGFKSGSMRVCQSAAVISVSKTSGTTSYGLLSNIPFEHDKKHFVIEVETVDEEFNCVSGAHLQYGMHCCWTPVTCL